MKKLIFLLLVSLSHTIFSQDYVGLYVNDFKFIIGNTAAETELLEYAQNNGFNYLILYNLNYIHNNIFEIDDAVESIPLSDFIENAKINYGILQVAAVGEKNSSFDKIKTYNNFHTAASMKRFDVFNLEFEYWSNSKVDPGGYYCTTYLIPNGYACSITGATQFFVDQLALMKTYGDANGILIETYIGYLFNVAQTNQIVTNTHRILVHYYRTKDIYNSGDADPTNDYSIYQYPISDPDRIKQLIDANGDLESTVIMPIFSARPSHMFSWLLTHPLTQPYDTYLNGIDGFNDQVGSWKSEVDFDGYVWYRYTDLLEIDEILSTESQVYENKNIFYNKELNRIYFNNFDEKGEATVYNINGKKMMSFNLDEFYQLDKNLPKGIYIIIVKLGLKVWHNKIIIY